MWKGKKNTLKTLNPPQNCYESKKQKKRSEEKKCNQKKEIKLPTDRIYNN